MLSKLKQFDPDFNKTWARLEADEKRQGGRHSKKVKVVMQQLLDRTVRNLLDKLNVSEFAQLGYEWNELINEEYFKCATDPFHLDNKCL